MRKRSKYRPKSVISDPLTLMVPVSAERRNKVILKFLTAIEAMRAGTDPGNEEWRSLSDAVNTVETLALWQKKIDAAEVMPTVNAAIAGMVHASRRFKAGQGMRLDAAGLEALRDVISIYEECAIRFTEREMAMAQAETQRRVHELLRRREACPEVVCV
jgi:hypothetical protein